MFGLRSSKGTSIVSFTLVGLSSSTSVFTYGVTPSGPHLRNRRASRQPFGTQGVSRRSLAARIGAQTTTGGVVVVADTNQYRLLLRPAGPPPGPPPHPPRPPGHPWNGPASQQVGASCPVTDGYGRPV